MRQTWSTSAFHDLRTRSLLIRFASARSKSLFLRLLCRGRIGFQDQLFARIVEDDFEAAQNFNADVARQSIVHRRAIQEKVCLWFLDDNLAQLELRQGAGHRASIAADSFAHAV